jgi:hypothetical protein
MKERGKKEVAESGRRGIVSKVGMARRAVPNLRREAPFPEQERLQPMRFATPAWQAAAKVGRLRPPARHLRLGERGIPTHSFRRALPRRWHLRRL